MTSAALHGVLTNVDEFAAAAAASSLRRFTPSTTTLGMQTAFTPISLLAALQQKRSFGASSHGSSCTPTHMTLRSSLGPKYVSRISPLSGAQSLDEEQGPSMAEYVKPAPPAGSAGTQTSTSPNSSSSTLSSCSVHPKSSSSARGPASPSQRDVRHSSGRL